jgi:threonine aldolase
VTARRKAHANSEGAGIAGPFSFPAPEPGSTTMDRIVDLRSDTVTRPTPAMRRAMAEAPVGDDVYGEDPSVNALEARIAALLGFEAALFLPSGTQSNLVALLTHCGRGDEYLAGADAHTYRYEGGGAAVLGGIQPQPVPMLEDGSLDLQAVAAAVKPDDFHFARTRLLCLENTQAGRALPLSRIDASVALARARGLAVHVDGARLMNAAVALGERPDRLVRGCDSVSLCLSKGLGAPVGSVLAGSAAFVAGARRWRKVAGGGMRQAGILAAAGLHALEHHVDRLAEDHRRAERLARGLTALPAFAAHPPRQATNMVFLTHPPEQIAALAGHLESWGIRIHGRGRLVTHLDVDDEAVDRVVDAAAAFDGTAAAPVARHAGY